MEQSTILDDNVSGESLALTRESLVYLNEIRRWTMFFAILGFIGVALLVLMAFFVGAVFQLFSQFPGAGPGGNMPTTMFTVIYLVIALLYFFPVLYLYRFSSNLKRALQLNDTDSLTMSFRWMKAHFKFVGVITIVLLSFYALALLIGIFAGAGALLMG
jgi:hypothetical protein